MNLSPQEEFEYLISSKRKNPRVVARTLGKTVVNLGELLKEQKRPHYLGDALYEGCKSISVYAHDEEIENIILIDKSARPLWVGISQYGKLAYPDNKQPKFQFINPSLLRHVLKESENPEELRQNITRMGESYIEDLLISRSEIASRTEEPLLLVDTCLHSGRSAYLTRRVLNEVGFSDVRFGVIKTTLPSGEVMTPDVSGTSNILAAHCIRSDISTSLVADNNYSMHSAPRHEPLVNEIGRNVRRDIGALIATRYRIDNE